MGGTSRKKLTESEREKIVQHLHKTVKTVECGWCGKNQWAPGPELGEIREYFPSGLQTGGITYPVVIVTCQNCAHTLLFNAVGMGIVERGKAEGGEENG